MKRRLIAVMSAVMIVGLMVTTVGCSNSNKDSEPDTNISSPANAQNNSTSDNVVGVKQDTQTADDSTNTSNASNSTANASNGTATNGASTGPVLSGAKNFTIPFIAGGTNVKFDEYGRIIINESNVFEGDAPDNLPKEAKDYLIALKFHDKDKVRPEIKDNFIEIEPVPGVEPGDERIKDLGNYEEIPAELAKKLINFPMADKNLNYVSSYTVQVGGFRRGAIVEEKTATGEVNRSREYDDTYNNLYKLNATSKYCEYHTEQLVNPTYTNNPLFEETLFYYLDGKGNEQVYNQYEVRNNDGTSQYYLDLKSESPTNKSAYSVGFNLSDLTYYGTIDRAENEYIITAYISSMDIGNLGSEILDDFFMTTHYEDMLADYNTQVIYKIKFFFDIDTELLKVIKMEYDDTAIKVYKEGMNLEKCDLKEGYIFAFSDYNVTEIAENPMNELKPAENTDPQHTYAFQDGRLYNFAKIPEYKFSSINHDMIEAARELITEQEEGEKLYNTTLEWCLYNAVYDNAFAIIPEIIQRRGNDFTVNNDTSNNCISTVRSKFLSNCSLAGIRVLYIPSKGFSGDTIEEFMESDEAFAKMIKNAEDKIIDKYLELYQ